MLLGGLIFSSPKGTLAHRVWGWLWIACLTSVCLTGGFIQAIIPGSFSTLHILIPVTMVLIVYSIWNIKMYQQTQNDIYRQAHMASMIAVYGGALMIAGVFTLLPGRLIGNAFYNLL